MSKISIELPVKLEELCQLSFNFNNLITIIQYLHNNNISFQQELKDIDRRLETVECLKNDIEDLKIKTSCIERTNDNLNRSFANLQDNILKYDSKFSEIQKKITEFDSKFKDIETKQIENEQNFNHLNIGLENNTKAMKEFDTELNGQKENLKKISEKVDENEKKEIEQFETVYTNIKEIKKNSDEEHKEISDIKKHIEEINVTIKNKNNIYEKKMADLNERITNILNDTAKMNKQWESHINKKSFKHLPKEEITEKVESINKDYNSNDLFKIAMDNLEEMNNKLITFKEDYESNKEKQKKENIFLKKNITQIIDDYNQLKQIVEKNKENMDNNYFNFMNVKEESEVKNEKDEKKSTKSDGIDLKQLQFYLNKFVPFDVFKKLSDNVRILTSSLNSKINREEIETQLKKFNQRIENIEMIQQGQTHGPKTRINIGLVNTPITHIDDPNIQLNTDEQTEIEHLCKRIEKKVNENIMRNINKEIQNWDLSLNPKIIEIENNYNQICEETEKNNQNITDFRNILLSNPTQNEFLKIKKVIEYLDDECRNNKLRIIELVNNIEGSTEENEGGGESTSLTGTIKDRINLLNKTCQTLNYKIGTLEVKNRTFTKEVKDEIKQNLKSETIKIMQQFKTRLESFTTKFEHELKNKIDQINLSDFENKMNNKIHIDLKDKLDKNDLKKNNNVIKKKIDSLETKISKTFVDTLIDLQMEEQPLIIKKTGNGADVCASCNQHISKNTFYGNGEMYSNYVNNKTISNRAKTMNRSFINFTQQPNCRLIKNTERNLHLNLSLGQNKLPDIVPSINTK